MSDAHNDSPWLLTTDEAAKLLHISPRAMFQLGKDRKIPVVRIGRSVRFDTGDLRRWIEQQKQAGSALIGN